MDADLDEMKDLQSFTGVNGAYRVMAVSPHAKRLLFKRSNKKLHMLEIGDEIQRCNFTIVGIDLSHGEDTVFNLAFLDEETICVVLQNRDGKLYITKGFLNLTLKIVIICSAITFTQIISRKHYSTSLIYDEKGPVLISHPLSFQNKNDKDPPKIWLLHLYQFYTRKGTRTVVLEPNIKDKKALFCDPFIYRNRLFLFNRFENALLCITISENHRGIPQILRTIADPHFHRPNNKYANRCLFPLGDIVLVYCYQRLDKPQEAPQLWILKLKTMSWHRLQLILNHHYPIGSVSFQKAIGEQMAFLHGECTRKGCLEKAHLYQLSTTQECIMSCARDDRTCRKSLIDRKSTGKGSKRSISAIEMHRLSNLFSTTTTTTTTTMEVTIPCTDRTVPNGRIAPILRYMKKCNHAKLRKNSSSSKSQFTRSSNRHHHSLSLSLSPPSSSSSLPPSKVVNSEKNDQYVHWSEEMVEEGDALTISEQLKLAKDMGYSDEEIMQAISMNCAKDGSYRAFSSTNAMIDMLARVQRMCETAAAIDSGLDSGSGIGKKWDTNIPMGSSCDADLDRSTYARCSTTQPPSGSGIRRTTSFQNASSSANKSTESITSSSFHEYRSAPPQFQLQRLLDAFEKEQKSFNDESTRSIRALEERCRQFADNQAILQVRLMEKDSEIELLKTQLSTRAVLDEQLRLSKVKLDAELLDNKSKTDQIRVLTEQAEVVKRQHDSEIREKDKLISELFSKLKAAEDANKPALEKNKMLQGEIDELKNQLAKKEADLEKCGNCYDEMRKAEQMIEQIRLERDEVRSTLNKIPTCVICLDKRPQMLYMPCSHFICCELCGNRFEHCPACRQKICGKITVYQ